MEINVHQAKTHFSKLLERVALGETVTIAKAGRPVAKLVPLTRSRARRRLGSAAGQFRVPDDFDAPLPPEIEQAFWR